MRPFNFAGLLVAPLLIAGIAGCRTTQQPGPAVTQTAQPAVQTATGQAGQTPDFQIDATQRDALKAGRAAHRPGQQRRRSRHADGQLVVFSGGKNVEGAVVTVLNPKGKVEATGTTNDWGEFHAAFAQGRYNVKLEWQGKLVEKEVRVDERRRRSI